MFNVFIVQPIYNLLVAIYGLLPGHDLGVSLIVFTVLIRLAMWPLLKKQLRQNRVMQSLKPDLKKIKTAAAGDKQKEGRLMMELYKEKGISPFGTIGITLVQLPIFIGVFQAARKLTEHIDTIGTFTYGFVQRIPYIASVIENNANFNFKAFGFIDLSKRAINGGEIYIPIMIIAVAATIFQYFQSKQIMPTSGEKKKLRDILRSSATSGKQPEQDDISAAMGSSMLFLMPILTMLFAVSAQGPMVMYLFAASVIGIIQQTIILRKDKDDMQAEVVSVKSTPLSRVKDTESVPKKELKKSVEKAKPVAVATKEKISEPKIKKKRGKVVTKTRIITPTETQKPTQSQKAKKAARKKSKKRKR